jgi:hypothetical protein
VEPAAITASEVSGAIASNAASTAMAPAAIAPRRILFGERAGPRFSEGQPVALAAIIWCAGVGAN